jgi:hypothetical protein
MLLATVLLAVGLMGLSTSEGPLTYLSFAGMLLGMVALGAAVIFAFQAAIGSTEPVSFALPPDYVPVRFRDKLRAILIKEWNPQEKDPNDLRAYDFYLGTIYQMADYNSSPEHIASELEQIEVRDALAPGSTVERRLETAEQLIVLLIGRTVSIHI